MNWTNYWFLWVGVVDDSRVQFQLLLLVLCTGVAVASDQEAEKLCLASLTETTFWL